MTSTASTVDEYIDSLPEDRKEAMQKLRTICSAKIKGAEECMSYGMIGYVIPFKTYPNGYHCNTSLPLPFIAIASQKNFIAIYHMGMYLKLELLDWFVTEFPKHSTKKMDMGKSCMRFKKVEDIPYKFIEELMGKMSVKEWIQLYESVLLKKEK
jgi:Domain of unknown function (DU1801)